MFGWLRRLLGPTISVTGGEAHFPNVDAVDTLNMGGGKVYLGGDGLRMTNRGDGEKAQYSYAKTDTPPGWKVNTAPDPEVKRTYNFTIMGEHLCVDSSSDGAHFALKRRYRGVIYSVDRIVFPKYQIPEAIRLLERAREELERG